MSVSVSRTKDASADVISLRRGTMSRFGVSNEQIRGKSQMNEQVRTERARVAGARQGRRMTRRTTIPLAAGAALLVVAIAQCMLLGAFLGGLNSPDVSGARTLSLSYSAFQTQVAGGNVAWVTIDASTGTIDGGLRRPMRRHPCKARSQRRIA